MDMSSLPDDLLSEILWRLPVESFTRFKAVSKTWLSLISSSYFVKSFLDRVYTNAGDDKSTLLVHNIKCKSDQDDTYALFHLGCGDQLVADIGSPFSSESRFPINPESHQPVFVGSDCGIVCISVLVYVDEWRRGFGADMIYSFGTNIYLWNPATKHVNLIPALDLHEEDDTEAIGFGFDCVSLDFKVVRVVYRSCWWVHSCEVYSANRKSWQKIEAEPINNFYGINSFNVTLHGFLLSAGYTGMIAFDLHKEVFCCQIELPDIDDHENFEATITDFNDSIAVIISKNKGFSEKLKLWTLDDEACLRGGEVKTSWTMLLSIDLDQPVQFVVGYFNHGDLLLVSKDCDLLSYNFDKKEVKKVQACFDHKQVCKYKESLIPVAGSEPVYWSSDSEDDWSSDSEDDDSESS